MSLFMNPWVLLGIAIALAGSHFAAYRHGVTVTEGAYAMAAQEGQKARDDALQAAAKEIAKIDVKNVTIRQNLEKEVHEKTVYRDCLNTADSMQLINAALTNIIPSGNGKLPGINPTK